MKRLTALVLLASAAWPGLAWAGSVEEVPHGMVVTTDAGDKVRVLPPRGSVKKGDQRLWQVTTLQKSQKVADLELLGHSEMEVQTAPLDDLVVVAEFRDTIYPGLVSTGKVEPVDFTSLETQQAIAQPDSAKVLFAEGVGK